MSAGVVLFEAKIGARRTASNIGSVARLEDIESDGGISAAQTETGDNVHVGPLPVFTGAESLSSARAETPLSSWTRLKDNDLSVHERAGPGLPVGARGQARSSSDMIDTPIAHSFTSNVMIHTSVISEGFAPELAENHRWQPTYPRCSPSRQQ